MNIRYFLSTLIILVSFCNLSKSQNNFSISAGINTDDTYEIEIAYHKLILPYFGIGAGLCFDKEWGLNFDDPYHELNGSYISWTINEKENRLCRISLRPSLLLRTPTLFTINNANIILQTEPGLQLAIPFSSVSVEYTKRQTPQEKDIKYHSSNNGDWFFWKIKNTIYYQKGKVSLGLGYSISNIDIYSSRRKIKIKGTSLNSYYKNEKLTHSLFLSTSYKF